MYKKNKNCPKVSIIIPVYNAEKFLEECLFSAYNQTYKNLEIIVVNDGSKDNSEKVILDFIKKQKSKNIFYYKKNNGGTSSALNFGILKSNGEYISWLSADDKYCLNKIKIQIETILKLKNKNIVVYSDWGIFGDIHKKKWCKSNYSYIRGNFNNWIWALTSWSINGCTFLIPKIIFENNLFNENLKTVQDYQKWIDFYKKGIELYFIKKVLVMRRVHKNQSTNLMINDLILEEKKMRINFYRDLSILELSKAKKNPYTFFLWLKYMTKNSMNTDDEYKNFINKKLIEFSSFKNKKSKNIFYDYNKFSLSGYNLSRIKNLIFYFIQKLKIIFKKMKIIK